MKVSLGGVARSNSENWFTLSKREIYSPQGRFMFTRYRYHVKGVILGDDAAAVKSGVDSLESYYVTNGSKDFAILHDDGSATGHAISAANTVNGIRIIGGVNFHEGLQPLWGMGVEGINRRTYSVIIEADVLSDNSSGIVMWHESLRYIGDGSPDFAIQESLNYPPQPQTTCLYTSRAAIQSGYAVGLTGWPSYPLPLFPGSFKPKQSWTDDKTPELWGLYTNLNFKIMWSYYFEAAVGFSGALGFPL